MILRPIKWHIKEQSTFLRRIGTLLDEGYTLREAIRFQYIQSESKRQREIRNIEERLKDGSRFYEVLKNARFHPLSVSFCFYGEQNGQLAESLRTAGEMLQRRYEDQNRLKKLAAYPAFLLLLTGLLFFLFQWLLLPQFFYLYESFQVEPNATLRFLLWLHAHPNELLIGGVFIIATFLFVLNRVKRAKTSYEFQCMISRLPMIGTWVRLLNTYYISYQFSRLLKNGLSLSETLQFIKRDPERMYLRETAVRIEGQLLAGKTFDAAIMDIPFWQRELGFVIQHGQVSGKLESELDAFSRYCLENLSERMEKLLKIVQPVLFATIGSWILFMYFSIMLPSFQLMNEL